MSQETLRATENSQTLQKKGTLPDGRSVLRLQGDNPESYGFYLADNDSRITKVDKKKALTGINELLHTLSLDPVENIPNLFLVVKSAGEKLGKDNRVQFVDVETAEQRKNVNPLYSDSNGNRIDAKKMSPSEFVPLEKDYFMAQVDGRLATINRSTGELHSPNFRRCSAYPLSGEDALRIIPQLSKIENKKWRNAYAKEIKRRLISSGLPDNSNFSSHDLAGIGKEESQMLSMTFEEWRKSILDKEPVAYWKKEAETISTKVTPEKLKADDIPPHMNIATDSQKREFMTVARIASLQKQTYRDIARQRINGGLPENNETTQITAEDIRQVQATITEAEIQEMRELSKRNNEQETNTEWTRNATNFISITGLPHEMLRVSEEILKTTPEAPTPLSITNGTGKSSKENQAGMFTKAAQNSIEDPKNPVWGGEVRSILTPEQVAEYMRSHVKIPLVTLEQLKINPGNINSPQQKARVIWRMLTSRQVENKGTNVRTPDGEKQIADKIHTAVESDKPVEVVIFGPWGTAPSELRSGKRKQPHLAHLDFLTQFARINTTVEQAYKPSNGEPAVRFHWINESSAFVPHIDKRNMKQIQGFEDRMKEWVKILSPDKDVFHVYHMGELLWDTLEKRRIYDEFRSNYVRRASRLFEERENGQLTDGKDRKWVEEKSRLIYPIATIIDPYEFLPLDTHLGKIAVAYELIRAKVTGKVEELQKRGVVVDEETEEIASELYQRARELVITQYIPIMDARYETPKYVSEENRQHYQRIDPWQPIYEGKVHGRITDGGTNRWWVKLNSGSNITHPTHGYPIVNAPLEQGKSPSLDIRTWSEILTEPQRYAPVYLKGDENTPFHLIRLH